MQALTLKGDTDTKTVTDVQATNMEEPNNNNQATEEGDSSVPPLQNVRAITTTAEERSKVQHLHKCYRVQRR